MKRIILFTILLFLFSSGSSVAYDIINFDESRSVTLEWDENDDADYYIVYWTKDKSKYDLPNTVPCDASDLDCFEMFKSDNINIPAINYTIEKIPYSLFYVAVKAFNSCGNSSDWSDRIIWLPKPENFRAELQYDIYEKSMMVALATLGAVATIGGAVVTADKVMAKKSDDVV